MAVWIIEAGMNRQQRSCSCACSCAGSHSNLFSNVTFGLGQRAFQSGGEGGRGAHSGANNTFWNLQVQANTTHNLCRAMYDSRVYPCKGVFTLCLALSKPAASRSFLPSRLAFPPCRQPSPSPR
jgi:hypothetical protein